MKFTVISCVAMLFLSTSAFSNTGGPDAYGYTWIDSNEPGGPAFNWIDITASGTLVSGLTDDNSAAFIPMGMNFHYYWSDYSQLKVGSNGWLSFENTGNIAHCFPTIPTPGGAADNFLAPFMTDLNFAGAGNPAQVYYMYDAPFDRFIVSYIDVPWWVATPPDYAGSNTFQVIFSNSDSSITFQYQTTDVANFNDLGTCASDLVIGIEAPTGTIGLTAYQDVIPPLNYTIKFEYPNPVLIQIPDIAPFWSLNTSKAGEFSYIGENIQVPINIKSVGSDNISTDITVDVLIQDQAMATIATYQQIISGGLLAGADTNLQFLWIPTATGQYSVQTTITNTDDINATNDVLITEYEILDPAPLFENRLSYVNTTDVQMSSIAWNSGSADGVGTHFVPNSYPFNLDSMAAYVMGAGDVVLEVYLDDGANNLPGTQIHTETFLSGSIVLNNWIMSTLTTPYGITSGGFYLVWIQPSAASTSLGTVINPPFSRRNYEFVSGWAEYRDNESQEFMLEAYGNNVCASLMASTAITNPSCAGDSDGSIDLTVFGGTPSIVNGYTYSWTAGAGTNEDPTGLAAGQYIVTITDSLGCIRTETVDIVDPTAIVLSATSTDEIVAGDGTIDLTVAGGTAPYTFSWTSGAGTDEDPTNLAGGTYTVTVTDANGCTQTLDVTVESQLGINSQTVDINWNVFPNPSNGEINIVLEDGFTLATQIEIRDALGRIIYSSVAKVNQQILVSAKGVYFVVLENSKGQSVKRIVIR